MISIWVFIITCIILIGMIIHQWWRYRTLLECNICLQHYLNTYINKYGKSFEICDRIINDTDNNK